MKDNGKIDEMIGEMVAAVGRIDAPMIGLIAEVLIESFEAGGRVYVCGNGGSAADAQHIAAELVGRFRREDRKPLPCVALTTDTSALTAIANDFGFEQVFSRQIEALGDKGDVLWVLSTSGKSPNIISAAKSAKQRGMKVVAMTGGSGGELAELADVCFSAPGQWSDQIQQVHQLAYHIICEVIDEHFVLTL
jgi:D-sedoheptulose 7-phosphate isomerase